MLPVRPKIRVPKTAQVGEVIKIKALISHPMESGLRKNKKTGKPIPKDIINRFEAKFEGETFFAVTMHPAVSADPYFAFHFEVPGSGNLSFHWSDEKGQNWQMQHKLAIA